MTPKLGSDSRLHVGAELTIYTVGGNLGGAKATGAHMCLAHLQSSPLLTIAEREWGHHSVPETPPGA